jgi:hypothetical protein
MTAAEVILRVGGAIGGWMILLAHGLVIASIPHADCDPRSDEMWLGTLLLGTLDGFGLILLGRGLAWRASLRWFAPPAVALAIYACWVIAPSIAFTTFDGASLCHWVDRPSTAMDVFPATPVQRVWPIFQIAVFLAACGSAARYWRR